MMSPLEKLTAMVGVLLIVFIAAWVDIIIDDIKFERSHRGLDIHFWKEKKKR